MASTTSQSKGPNSLPPAPTAFGSSLPFFSFRHRIVRWGTSNVEADKKRGNIPGDPARVTYEVGNGWAGVPGKLFDVVSAPSNLRPSVRAPLALGSHFALYPVFEQIHVGAAAERVPPALLGQLKAPGRMIVPVGRGKSVPRGHTLVPLVHLDSAPWRSLLAGFQSLIQVGTLT